MTLLNPWVLFAFIPLFLIYKKHASHYPSRQTTLLYLALFFMFVSMSRPAIQESYVNENFNSSDYIIAIDASYSMQANDLKPSRYAVAKEAIKELIHSHPKDRFTLFAFTSSTLLLSPPTTDAELSLQALDALNPEYILTKSTNLENLFNRIAKIDMKKKLLIIFTDGGDSHDISSIATTAKRHGIIPYIVATATQKGAALKKDGKYIKDRDDSIVISKINPMLIDLVNASNGKYYELTTQEDISTLFDDLGNLAEDKEPIIIKSYQELFYLPLSIAIALYFIAITKFMKYLLLHILLLFAIPQPTDASLIDFIHLNNANSAYKSQDYKQAAIEFSLLTASTHSYYNLGISLYKSGYYRDAIAIFSQIKTTDRALKAKIFYNIANCATKLKRYDEAKLYYIHSLALKEDKDALYNLTLLRKLALKNRKDISKIMPRNQTDRRKKSVLKGKKSNTNSPSSSKNSTNRSASKQSNGGGGKKDKKSKVMAPSDSSDKNRHTYKFTYKAYEQINKGYTDEKEPW